MAQRTNDAPTRESRVSCENAIRPLATKMEIAPPAPCAQVGRFILPGEEIGARA
jgi:hypothetical protein